MALYSAENAKFLRIVLFEILKIFYRSIDCQNIRIPINILIILLLIRLPLTFIFTRIPNIILYLKMWNSLVLISTF